MNKSNGMTGIRGPARVGDNQLSLPGQVGAVLDHGKVNAHAGQPGGKRQSVEPSFAVYEAVVSMRSGELWWTVVTRRVSWKVGPLLLADADFGASNLRYP